MAPRRYLSKAPSNASFGSAYRHYRLVSHAPHERGAFAIMFIPLLILIVAMSGVALNTGVLYNRKAELSGLAKAVALAAAQELNGTSAGIAAAQVKAKEAAERFTYQYGLSVTWDNAAIKFSTLPSRSGEWVLGSDVGNASNYYFVKVDTAALPSLGEVTPIFPDIFSTLPKTVLVSDSAVAGRASINVTPITICAMSEDLATERTNTGLSITNSWSTAFAAGSTTTSCN